MLGCAGAVPDRVQLPPVPPVQSRNFNKFSSTSQANRAVFGRLCSVLEAELKKKTGIDWVCVDSHLYAYGYIMVGASLACSFCFVGFAGVGATEGPGVALWCSYRTAPVWCSYPQSGFAFLLAVCWPGEASRAAL